jgi:hypothetical protein
MILWAANEQLPDDVGKSGPFGLLLLVLGLIVVGFLVRSMTRHLKQLPPSFDRADERDDVVVPDTPEQLLAERGEPGEGVLDALRRAPRAIEPPRDGERGTGA